MSIEGAVEYYDKTQPRGEFVLIIDGKSEKEQLNETREKWAGSSLAEHLEYYVDLGLDKKEAMKKVASDLGISKRDVYNELNRG